MFGSDAVKTKRIKKIYTTTKASLINLCENVLFNNSTKNDDESDDVEDFASHTRCMRSSSQDVHPNIVFQ